MKGGILLILGVVLMLIVVLVLVGVVMCTSPVNKDSFFCGPIMPLTELAQKFIG
jgi:hypothetical protein